MSRVRTELSVVQFQVQARDANAALESMQNRASELRGEIDSVQQKIKAIGDVEVETPELIGFKNQLSQLERKLKDVINAQRELTKGVRAADKVWKAAQTGTMEQLTIKELKAGERGVRARMQNLSPGNADDAKTLRAYNAVLEETRIAIRGFEGEVQHVLQTIHDGGNVSADMLKRAKDGLHDLKDVTAQGTKEWNDYRLQLEELGRYEQQQIDTERRLRGEMANVNDAREAAAKLTKEGAEAARQASQAYEEEIKAGREKIASLTEQRDAKEAEARATSEAIVETDKLIAKNQQEIDATEKSIKADKKKTEADRQKAEQARKTAEQAKADYEKQKENFEKESAAIEGLADKVGKLQGKLQALGTQSVKPQVDTSEIDELQADITSLSGTIEELKKQRKKLTAVQTAGAEAAKKDGEAIKMSAAEADAALKKRAEKSTVTLRGDNGLELSNPAEFFNRVKAFILKANPDSGNYEYHGETGFQTANKEQLKNVAKNVAEMYGFKDEYGRDDISAAMEVLRRFSLGKSGGPIKGGSFDKNQGILKLDFDPETWKAYVDESKELFAITKGATQATNEQSAANERNAQSEKDLAEAEQERARLTQQITVLETQRQQKQEQLSQLQQQAAQDTGEQERLTEELANKTAELTKKKEELSVQEKKLNFAKEEAVKKDKEATELESKLNQNSDERTEKLKEQRNEEQVLIAQREEQVKKLVEQNQQTTQLNQQIGAEATKMQEAEQKKAQAQELTADKMREAIALLEKRNKALNDSEPEWVENERLIAQYNQRLDEMKRKSDELRREPVTEMMQQRIQNIGNLSNDAVAETRKFWQAMYDGAERNDPKLKEIEQNLKAINAEEQKRNAGALKESAGKLLGDITTLSEGELRKSIEAAREYQKTLVVGEEEHRKYSEAIVAAENRISKFGVEAERASQRQAESIQLMQDQLGKGDSLTESALKAQERFWQHLIDDPKSAAESLDTYKESLKKVKELQDQMATTSNEQKALIVQSGTLDNYSEAEIRESINAAKELHAHMRSASPEAQKLAEAIAKAEVHVKKYGVESARAARQQAESNKLMQDQLNNIFYEKLYGIAMPTASQIKAQKQYWQHLIDDPKTAASSLQQYRDRLAEVEQLEREMIDINGKTALTWFQDGNDKNASGNQVKEMADKLKEYRGTLLQETNAAEIQQIDDILQRIGVSAKKAGEGLMDFEEAKKLALQAGEDVYGNKNPPFLASPEQIQAATKSIEKYREELFKTIKQKHDMGEATDAEEAELQELAKYLKNLKFEQDNFNMSRERMEGLMKAPISATSIDELRAAIKRADAELKRMGGSLGDNSDQYKEFAKQVKNAKAVLKGMEDQAKATNNVWAQAWNRLKTYVGMYMGFNAVWQRITGTMGDLMELSDKMGEVRKTTNLSAEAVGELATNLKKLDVRTSLTDLMNISASAGQLGLKTVEDVQGFTEAANKLMIALPEMGQEAATEMMRVAIATGEVDKIRKQLQDGTVEGSSATAVAMEKIGSTVDRLRASSASTAPEITDFIKRMGAIGAQSGISIDQIAALGSTISSLGMRVEMSATALSRMIPAIRNNAFDLAGVLGVTPESIRQLFDAGRGMEVIMMILQHIKDKNLDEDSIETLLGMGGMQEVMKELNQQGARAGIVFSGLSQNVDVLRQQLGIASQAYEENIAIQNEFDKMNETTAAKWERLKNQVEEMFVGDTAQRYLGVLIDLLRGLINLITGPLRASLLTILTLVGLLKIGIGAGLVNALKVVRDAFLNWHSSIQKVTAAMTAMNKAQWANIFVAIAGAVIMLVLQLKDAAIAMSAVEKAVADLEAEYRKGVKAIEDLFRAEAKSSVELENKRKKLEELKKAGKDTADAEKELERANIRHAESIREINSKYSDYLGYMLSETTSAEELAAARELINSKLRETITLKQQEAALGNVEEKYGKDVNDAAGNLEKKINKFVDNYSKAATLSAKISEAAEKYASDSKSFDTVVRKILKDNLKGYKGKYGWQNESTASAQIMIAAKEYREAIEEYNKQEDIVKNRFNAKNTNNRNTSRENVNATLNTILKYWNKAREKFESAQGEEKKQAAVEMYQQQRNYTNAYNNNSGYFENDKRKSVYEKNIKNMSSFEKRLRNVADKEISAIDQKERVNSKATDSNLTNGNNNSQRNPWGNDEEAASTDWKKMTGKQLVARREQMNKFVNALQNDTDVKAVLAEDAALMKAFKGRQADMRSVIEWYNTERLKIQEELHARHLTNTGDWMDPKKQRQAKNQVKDDMKYYLDELDAYYTERKAKIQDAQNDGEISEAEAQNRTLANEAEWRKRRAELQQLYADEAKKVTGDEQQAIFNIISERTGDTADFVQKDINQTVKFIRAIGEKSRVAMEKIKGSLDKDIEKDFLRQRQAVGKHLEAIQAILDKERPFNDITKDLQDNLTTMGILAAHLNKERDELMAKNADKTEFNHKQSEEMFKELAFLLRESETAYSTTAEELMRRAAKAGLQAWVDEMKNNPQMQEGLMAQLRSTYDAVQDAIKKEAAIIKRHLETQWSDILPGADMSRKDTFEKAISDLGLMGDQLNRANSLISAGTASQRVADKLAIKQLEVQLQMQQVYYAMMQKIGNERVRQLNASAQASKRNAEALKKKSEELKKQGRLEEAEQAALKAQDAERRALNASFDAEYAQKSLNLAKTKELAEEEKQRVAIQNQLEESQNRLYTQLREWAGLLTSSLQSLFEASHAGDAEYYNELAKLNLTGSGGPGAGTYVIIENEGTSDATAHYEYLDQRQALERQREIEQQNAVADAWKKVMDDINMKMSDMITDQLNAMLQNASVDANTQAVIKNTEAIYASMGARDYSDPSNLRRNSEGFAIDSDGQVIALIPPTESADASDAAGLDNMQNGYQAMKAASDDATKTVIDNNQKQAQSAIDRNKKEKNSTQSTYAAMAAAMNMYGLAYQTMSNDNMEATQKFLMFSLQAAGQVAIGMLTTNMLQTDAQSKVELPGILGKAASQLGPIAGPIAFAAMTALLGGLMGLAMSKVSKSKSQIAQVTGASVGAGRLSTGMLTYAEGNVNEFTDPASLTPGRQYNVDAADGRTYRARYMGNNPKTHLTNGPEFHLSGEKGREMIIDAGTTRQITMNETGIWHAIQTLSGGGRIAATRRRGGGVRAFADGNVSEFEDMSNIGDTGSMGIATEQTVALQASIDRQSDLLERALTEGIKGVFNVYGKDGLVDSYDRGKKTLNRHGEKY